jgi:hypothetical protein
MGGRAIALDDRPEPVSDVGVSIEAEHRVRLRKRLGQLLAVSFREASDGHDQLSTGTRRPTACPATGRSENGIYRVLLGRLDEAAGVDDHRGRIACILDEPKAA